MTILGGFPRCHPRALPEGPDAAARQKITCFEACGGILAVTPAGPTATGRPYRVAIGTGPLASATLHGSKRSASASPVLKTFTSVLPSDLRTRWMMTGSP